MKKLLSGIGRAFFPFRNPKRMVGWDQLAESFKHSVRNPAKEVWDRKNKNAKIRPAETFEQAVIRLNMSDTDITARKRSLLKTTLLFAVMAIALLVYAVELLFTGLFLGAFIAGVLVLIALALAFRDHFWYTQLKQRRLGMNFKDWLNCAAGGIKR